MSTIPNINCPKYCKADLTLILQRVINSNYTQNIYNNQQKELQTRYFRTKTQTKYVHRHFKCVAGCSGPYIAVILLEQSNFCFQQTIGHKHMVSQSQHYDGEQSVNPFGKSPLIQTCVTRLETCVLVAYLMRVAMLVEELTSCAL